MYTTKLSGWYQLKFLSNNNIDLNPKLLKCINLHPPDFIQLISCETHDLSHLNT